MENEIMTIIILICLMVEKATIFFRSISEFAINPPRRKVKKEIDAKIKSKLNRFKNMDSFIKRKTPAVTRVDECTIAEIGVGADIAAGSQEERGN